jgi:hypothetical protein
MTTTEELRQRIHCRPQSIEEAPACVYGRLTREMLEQVQRELAEIKSRINLLLFSVAGAVILELAIRLMQGQ